MEISTPIRASCSNGIALMRSGTRRRTASTLCTHTNWQESESQQGVVHHTEEGERRERRGRGDIGRKRVRN